MGDWGFIVLGDTVEVMMYEDRGRRGRITEIDHQFGFVRIEGVRVKEESVFDREAVAMKTVAINGPGLQERDETHRSHHAESDRRSASVAL